VVAESADGVTVEHSSGELVVPLARVREVTPNPRPSPGYRLYRIRQTRPDPSASLGERRAFAGCAVAEGDLAGVEASGLGPREQAWLRMWTHFRQGGADAALAEAVTLGSDLYPDRLGLFVATIDRWVTDGDIRSLVFGFCTRLSDDPLAQVLFAVVADPMPDVAQLLDAAASSGAPGVVANERTRDVIGHIAHDRIVAAASGSQFVSEVSLRTLALRSVHPGSGVPNLAGIDMSVLDDAIDQEVLTREHLESVTAGLEPGARRYLTARLAPGDMTDDELVSIGHHDELHRRAFVVERLVSGAVDGGRFQLLDRLRRGDQRAVGELVPSLSPEHARVAIAVGSSLHSGVPDPIAVADPSTWDVLAPVLAQVASDRPDQLAGEVRDAAGWALLDLAKRELFDWRWSHAVHAAATCMSVVDDEPRSDEATAIKAAAAYMDGRRDLAVQYLVAAAEGDASDSLLVNLALLWADSEPRRAAGVLIRLASQTGDETLKARAAVRAARLCMGEDEDWEPPKTHLKLLRRACGADLDLAEHLEVMGLVACFDSNWIVNASHTSRSVHAQTLAHRLVIARAAGFEEVLDALEQSRDDPAETEVVRREVADIVQNVFLAMSSSQDPVAGAAMIGLSLFDRGLPVDDSVAVLLRTRCVQELSWFVSMSDEALFPLESLHGHLDEAARSVRSLDPEDRAEAREMVDQARVTLGSTWCGCWAREHDEIVDAFNRLVESYNDGLAQASSHYEIDRIQQVWLESIASLRLNLSVLLSNVRGHSAQIPRLEDVRERYDDLIQSIYELDAFLVEAAS